MQLAESTTLNKVLDFEVRHLQSMEMPALKVGATAPPAPAPTHTHANTRTHAVLPGWVCELVVVAPPCLCCAALQAEIERSAKYRSDVVARLQDHETKISDAAGVGPLAMPAFARGP
jgi:hypothetical protein